MAVDGPAPGRGFAPVSLRAIASRPARNSARIPARIAGLLVMLAALCPAVAPAQSPLPGRVAEAGEIALASRAPSYDPLERLFTVSAPANPRLEIAPHTGVGTGARTGAPGQRGAAFGFDEALTSERRYDRSWLLSRAAPQRNDAAWRCLKEAIYHEARGESVYGQFAVAEVILNRVDSESYPDDVCAVVNQNAHRRNACQFSFACNGRTRAMGDREARALAGRIADLMLSGAERELTDGATHFHTTRVNPSWARRLVRTARIGAHIFYRQPLELSRN